MAETILVERFDRDPGSWEVEVEASFDAIAEMLGLNDKRRLGMGFSWEKPNHILLSHPVGDVGVRVSFENFKKLL